MSHITYITLLSQNDGQFLTAPTIVAGDFKISKDGGAYVNLTNLPAVTPAGSPGVKIELTNEEIDAKNINIWGSDAAGAEWHEIFLPIDIKVIELWQLQGLDSDNAMNVTHNVRTAGNINLSITGDGRVTSTVTRT